MAGAPLGNKNVSNGMRWTNAISRAIDNYPDRAPSLTANRGLDNAAYEFVHKMMTDKDLGFFKEFGDRQEGKPAQAVTLGGDPQNPIQTLSEIVIRGINANG